MLNAEDNRLLTDISPGSPMGNLMRQYWMPVMLSEELPEADGNPVRLTVLCEDLVIFRGHRRAGRPVLGVLPPPPRLPLLRQERGGRPPLSVSRLEVRRHGAVSRHAERAAREQLQEQAPTGRVPVPRGRRHDLGLHGTAGDAAAAARVRMDEHAGGAAADIAVPARVQLDAGARGRHRHDALRVPPQPARARRVRREHLAAGNTRPAWRWSRRRPG